MQSVKLINLIGLILIPIFFLTSQEPEKQQSDIVTIDVIDAFKNKGDIKLSDFIDSVEIVTLQSDPDAFYTNPIGLQVGKDHIIVGHHRQQQESKVLLFSRSGKFIRSIGRKGNGPTEFTNVAGLAMSPDERFVVIIQRKDLSHYCSLNI